LYTGRQRHLAVVEALVDSVADSPVVVERGEDMVDGLHDIVLADNIEVALLLTGKGRVGQILAPES